jgi:hypothetical protein
MNWYWVLGILCGYGAVIYLAANYIDLDSFLDFEEDEQ